jgi:hypothetical protein
MSLADNLRQNSKSSQDGPKAAVCEGAAGDAAGAAPRSHEPRHPGLRTLAPEIR